MGQQEVHPGLGLLVAPDQDPQHRLEKYWFRCNFTLTGLIASLVKSVGVIFTLNIATVFHGGVEELQATSMEPILRK